MPLPLHKDAQQTKKGTHFHAGLWYDRFFNQYDGDWQVADEGKLKWISTVTGSLIGDQDALKQAAERQGAIAKACGGQSLVMTTDWHFVTGLGNNHPVENGFAWHHTLGVPYLTGAAVKGMVRAWCEVWQELDDDKIKQWFGGKGDEQAGELIFFDAIPVAPVKLKADIMTPHYGDWYAKGDEAPKVDGSNVPADWHDPVPVPFLVVDKGASFQFAVGKRAGSSVDLSEVTQALGEALQWLGAGAKTAAGYGRMIDGEAYKQKQEEAKKEAKEAKAKQAKQQMRQQGATQHRPRRQGGLSPAEIAKQRLMKKHAPSKQAASKPQQNHQQMKQPVPASKAAQQPKSTQAKHSKPKQSKAMVSENDLQKLAAKFNKK